MKRSQPNLKLKAVMVLLAAAWAPATVLGAYTITDVGTLGQPFTYAFAVDDAGRVAGTSARMDSRFHAYRWANGLVDLGTLAGVSLSHGVALDASGEVIGVSFDLGDRTPRAFRSNAGVLTSLGAFSARAVNASGDIGGWLTVTLASGWKADHACVLRAGLLSDLGTLGGSSSQALGMNDSGWIVGSSFLADDLTNRACLWTAGGPRDLGTLGGTDSQAYDINETGMVVGISKTSGGLPHAFSYQLDVTGNVQTRTDLGVLGNEALGHSAAYAVNASGVIVGTSGGHAIKWQGGVMTDLNTQIPVNSGWKLASATAISAGGRIVGLGLHEGALRGFLLTPPCAADTNGDGIINGADLSVLLSQFGQTVPVGTGADLNADGLVNGADLSVLLSNFGISC